MATTTTTTTTETPTTTTTTTTDNGVASTFSAFSFVTTANSNNVVLTNTGATYQLRIGRTIVVAVTGTLTGSVANYTLTTQEALDFAAGLAVTIPITALTNTDYSILPDDFYRVQLSEYFGTVVGVQSWLNTLTTFSYVLSLLNDKIVHTDRQIGLIEKRNIMSALIHIRALEILGPNPPISLEDTVISRIKYLKTL